MVEIRQTTVNETMISPDFAVLAGEYAAESQMEGLPPPVADFSMYEVMEAQGVFKIFTSWDSGRLTGIITLLWARLPHFSASIAMSESFFVRKQDRKGGAGLYLLDKAEDHARELGSPVLFLTAPFGSILAKVLPRRGYRPSNIILVKDLQ